MIGNKYNRLKKDQRGFALFVAIGVASIILLISVTMTNIALRQTIIASSARESQRAFYAADNGIECVLYWEIKNPTNPGESAFDPSGGQTINCAGTDFTVGGAQTSNFTVTFSPFTTCAEVTVDKVGVTTNIESRGRNSCSLTNVKRVERGIRVSY